MYRLLILLFFTFAWADRPVFSVKVGVVSNFPPLYSVDAAGHPQGFAIDMFDTIIKKADGSREYVIYETWQGALDALASGEIDIVPNMGVTKEREKIALFTDPIEVHELCVFVRSKTPSYTTLHELKERRLGSVQNDVSVAFLSTLSNQKAFIYPDNASMIFALLSHEIDGFVYPFSITNVLLHNLNLEDKIISLGAPIASFDRAIGVNRQKPYIHQILQEALYKSKQSAEFSTLREKWYGIRQKQKISLEDMIMIASGGVVIFVLFYFWMTKRNERALKKSVLEKTSALVDEIRRHENTELLLRKSEERFKFLFEKAPVAYQSLDETGNVYAVNEQWLKDMEYEHKEEVLGHWFGDFLTEESQEVFKNLLKQSGTIEAAETCILKMQTKTGEILLMDVSGRIHHSHDESMYTHWVLVNVTEIKLQEKMMLSQSRLAAMGEMIGMIAHQWRQPLAIMSMEINNIFADIELGSFSEEEMQKALKKVTQQIMFLSQTIEDFRNFFQPNKAKVLISLDQIMRDALGIVGKSLENNGIKIVLQGSLPHKENFFANELVQVFLNILNNARDVLIEKKVSDPEVVITLKEEKSMYSICVEDNGGGVDVKILPRVFEPYVSTKAKNGTGLGLYMSKIIIEKHCQGKLICTNTAHGACFSITLPKG